MSEPWQLKRTKQCKLCPWRTDVDPHDIPNGYDEQKHCNLKGTINRQEDAASIVKAIGSPLRIMACHEMHQAHCIGWLINQLGEGNNVALRFHMMDCTNFGEVETVGEQHQKFEDTLP